jgi:hypothetical protein
MSVLPVVELYVDRDDHQRRHPNDKHNRQRIDWQRIDWQRIDRQRIDRQRIDGKRIDREQFESRRRQPISIGRATFDLYLEYLWRCRFHPDGALTTFPPPIPEISLHVIRSRDPLSTTVCRAPDLFQTSLRLLSRRRRLR